MAIHEIGDLGVVGFDVESRFLRQSMKVRDSLTYVPTKTKTRMRDLFLAARPVVALMTQYDDIKSHVFPSDATGFFRVRDRIMYMLISGEREAHYADALRKLGMVLWDHMWRQSRRDEDSDEHAREMGDMFQRILLLPRSGPLESESE